MNVFTGAHAAAARMFAPSIARSLARGDTAKLTRLAASAGIHAPTWGEVFEQAFAMLDQDCLRTDYVLRSRLLAAQDGSGIWEEEHRIGLRRADVMTLRDGHLCTWEIKSDRDSLVRLSEQIAAYYAVAPYVWVATTAQFAEQVRASVPASVGVMVVGERLSVLREPVFYGESLSALALHNLARLAERQQVLACFGITVPPMASNIRRDQMIAEAYGGLDPLQIETATAQVWQQRRQMEPPTADAVNVLRLRLSRAERATLDAALAMPTTDRA